MGHSCYGIWVWGVKVSFCEGPVAEIMEDENFRLYFIMTIATIKGKSQQTAS